MTFSRFTIASDLIGLAVIAGLSLILGLTVNCFRVAPLSVLAYQEPLSNHAGASPSEITLADLQKQIGQPGVAIVDARPWQFFASGHIPSAINLPLSDLQASAPRTPLPPSLGKAALIIVYCSDVSCPAAKMAARLLEKSGYLHVIVFPGGWYAWKKAGLPIGYAS